MSISKLDRVLAAVIGLCLAVAAGAAHAESAFNLPRGVTPISHLVYWLHMRTFWICVGIAVVVFGVMLFSIIFHRKSRGAKAANFHEHVWVEIAWTAVPVLILIVMAVPAVGVLVKMHDYTGSRMSIKVTGYQWMWHYDYLDNGVAFYSKLAASTNRARTPGTELSPADVEHYLREVDNPLVVPTGKKIRLLITSGDVIHSWWVPQFGGKMDAMPGYVNQMWIKVLEPGVYRGQCAELCGRGHAYMPIVVVAKPPDAFRKWVKAHGGHVTASSDGATQAPPTTSKAGTRTTHPDNQPAGADVPASI